MAEIPLGQETLGRYRHPTEIKSMQMISNQFSVLLRKSVLGRGVSDRPGGEFRMEGECDLLQESVELEPLCSEGGLMRSGICCRL